MPTQSRYSDARFDKLELPSYKTCPCTPELPVAPWEGIRVNAPQEIFYDLAIPFVIPVCCAFRFATKGNPAKEPFKVTLTDVGKQISMQGMVAEENESIEIERDDRPIPAPPGADAPGQGYTIIGGSLNFDAGRYTKFAPHPGEFLMRVTRGELESNEVTIRIVGLGNGPLIKSVIEK